MEKKNIFKMFVNKIIDCAGEAGETEVWLEIAKDAGYLVIDKYNYFIAAYDEVNRMLYSMIDKPDKFCKGSGA